MAIVQLTGQEKENYLENLVTCIESAKQIESPISNDIKKINNLLNFLRHNHTFGIYEGVKIETRFSGFPIFAAITDLYVAKEHAESKLKYLPSMDQIKASVHEQLHSRSPNFKRCQRDFRTVRFLEQIKDAIFPKDVIEGVNVFEQEEGYEEYELTMGRYDSTKMRWNYYEIVLAQKIGESQYLDEGQITEHFSFLLDKCFRLGAKDVFSQLNELKRIAVMKVERAVLGPFYFTATMRDNPPSIRQILSNNQNGFILELEQQLIEDTDLYLSRDIEEALSSHYKENLKLKERLKRNFICSSDNIAELVEEHYANKPYITHMLTIPKSDSGSSGSNENRANPESKTESPKSSASARKGYPNLKWENKDEHPETYTD